VQGGVARYVAARLLRAAPALFLVSVAVFMLIRLLPGDPAAVMAGPDATPQQIAALRLRYGLDQPLPAQYVAWLGRVLQGDLGVAYRTGQPVAALILERAPATLYLALGAMAVIGVVGGAVGIFGAVRPRHPLTRLIAVANAAGLSIPTFWLGILLILLFAVALRWLPPSGYADPIERPMDFVRFLIMPAVTLGAVSAAVVARFLTSSMHEVQSADFIRTAHAKGLRERVVVGRHVLKNALPPVITVMAIQFGHLLGGAVITEAIFAWPGLGRLMLEAIGSRDYQTLQATILLTVVTFTVVNLAADIVTGLIDPRVRYAG
jgi:peptide/nickel transport system permease protein